MSATVRTQVDADEQRIELGTAVNWRLIVAAFGLGLAVLILTIGMSVIAGKPAATAEVQPTAVASREKKAATPVLPAARYQPREFVPPTPDVSPVKKSIASGTPDLALKRVVVVEPPPTSPEPVAVAPPVQPEPEKVVEPPPVPVFKRRSPYTEEELLAQLTAASREVDIDTEKGTTAKLLTDAKKATDKTDLKKPPLMDVVSKRDDLSGLPFRDMSKCQVDAKEAKALEFMSRDIRTAIAKSVDSRSKSSGSGSQSTERASAMWGYLDYKVTSTALREDVTVRLLEQMLLVQHEEKSLRLAVVRKLADAEGKTVGATLAQRAVFDLTAEVREAAIEALKSRPASEYRPVLLEARHYPWRAVADHAAEALVALNDRDAVFALADLLDKPDPQAPVQNAEKKWVAAELVRVNHLGNCVLCHAPSSDKKDSVRAVVPERGKSLPVIYYDGQKGDFSFIRADVTYLRQDFSVIQTVKEPNKWPDEQRFDYLVRKRELTKDEVTKLSAAKDAGMGDQPTYPQREAVLWALRELTKEDVGARSEDWRRFLAEEWTTPDP